MEIKDIRTDTDKDKIEAIYGGNNFKLKQLSYISDKDAETIALLKYPNSLNKVITGKRLVETIESQPPIVIDYLRDQLYALPWKGYSVDELIELGWIGTIL